MKATVNGTVIAQSNQTVEVDGIQYFPPDAIQKAFLEPSDMTTFCPKKGKASYYHLTVGGQKLLNTIFVYPSAKAPYAHIAGWFGVWVKPAAAEAGLAVAA